MKLELHEKQIELLNSKARFTVAGWGRRSGKTHAAAIWTYIRAMEKEREGVKYGASARHLIVSPTFGMCEDLYVDLFYDIAGKHIVDFSKRKLEFTMSNGRRVKLAGCDNPRSLLGGSIISLVGDEMQEWDIPLAWDRVLRPACGDLKAPCLFLGTPLPNAGDDWLKMYERGLNPDHKQWTSIHCNSTNNTFIDMQSEIDQARLDGVPEALINQEFFADFYIKSASHFNVSDVPEFTQIPGGSVVLTSVDLQGFGDLEGMTLTEVNRLDETAITTTAVCPNNNWYVLDITYGRWGVKETANKIAEVVGYYKPSLLGVEKGALRNAIAPFLDSSLREKDIFMEVQGLSHGGTAKVDRVFWALQGRYERGMIHYPVGSYPWKEYLNKQLMSFPSRSVHNDLPDSLAYIDQLSKSRIPQEVYDSWDYSDQEDFEPLDNITGY